MNDGGDLSLKFPGGFEGQARGTWGAVLLLVTAALVLIMVGAGWAAYSFNGSLKAIVQVNKEGHDAVLSRLQLLQWETSQASCSLALPADDDERLKALRSGDVCYYALFVYAPKSPIPTAVERPPGTPTRRQYPTSGFPAHPERRE